MTRNQNNHAARSTISLPNPGNLETSRFWRKSRLIAATGLAVLATFQNSRAADYTWNQTGVGTKLWSLNTNWSPNISGGPNAAGAFVLVNADITGAQTINLFNTGDPGTATKTVGRLDVGDVNGTAKYSIAAGNGGGILNFDGNGSNAHLNELSGSLGDTVSAAITLSSSLDITNASGNILAVNGGITSVTSGTKIISTSNGQVTLGGIIGDGSGVVAINQAGAGTLSLSVANTFSGGVTVSSGTVKVANGAALGVAANVILNGGDLSNGAASSVTVGQSLKVGDNATASVNGLNSQRLIIGTNTTTGTNTIGAGASLTFGYSTLNGLATNIGSSGTGASIILGAAASNILTIASPTITLGGNSTFTNNSSQLLIISGAIGDGGNNYAVTFDGAGSGKINLAPGASGNSYGGGTTINSGWISLSQSPSKSYFGSGTVSFNGGRISAQNSGGATVTNTVIIGDGASVTVGDTVGPVTFSGSTNFGAGASVAAVGAATFSGPSTLGGDISLAPNSGTMTFSGTIGDGGHGYGITVGGSGSVILTRINTYSGTTTVSAGTLLLSGAGSIASSTVIDVKSGAALDVGGVVGGHYTFEAGQTLKGRGTILGGVSVNGNLQPGESPGLLTFGSSLTLGAASQTTMEIGTTGAPAPADRGISYDAIDVGGNLVYSGTLVLSIAAPIGNGTYDLFGGFTGESGDFLSSDGVVFSGGIYTGSFTENGGIWSASSGGKTFAFDLSTGDLSVVPEPQVWGLAALGFVVVLWCRRSPGAVFGSRTARVMRPFNWSLGRG